MSEDTQQTGTYKLGKCIYCGEIYTYRQSTYANICKFCRGGGGTRARKQRNLAMHKRLAAHDKKFAPVRTVKTMVNGLMIVRRGVCPIAPSINRPLY